MSSVNVTRLPKSQVKIDFVVSVEEVAPFLEQAVNDISTNKPIKGFRPGKATYEDVKRAYGEMLIWETAFERIVRAKYVKAVLEQDLETIGSPSVDMGKLVPGQDIEFSVMADLMPGVDRLADYSQPLVEYKPRKVGEKDVDAALQELRTMRRVEVAVDRAAGKEDLVIADLDILKDHVAIEGGASRGFKVYLNEAQYIPGFADKLVGIKKGEKRVFDMPFPEDHFNKQLAGQPVTFEVTAKDVYELQIPELNDEFAKAVGLETLDKLKELLTTNLQNEADQKADDATEVEMLDKIVKESRFSEIPDILMNEEVRRMLSELQQGVEQQGGHMEDYLSSIKKSMDQLRLDLIPQAMQRIQAAVALKNIAKKEQITVTDEEIDAEIDKILATVKPGDTQTRERLASPEYRDYVATAMKNRRVLGLLKTKAVKGYPVKA